METSCCMSTHWSCDCLSHVMSCNGATHTAAFLSARALLPALPTWPSCQRPGSVPWQADLPAAHLLNVEPSAGIVPRRAPVYGAGWGSSTCSAGLEEHPPYVTQIYNIVTRQVSLHYKRISCLSWISANVLFSVDKSRHEQQWSRPTGRPIAARLRCNSKAAVFWQRIS